MPAPHFTTIIIGAGLSGIGAACRLTQKSPASTFTILEARPTLGGTWDLFRYPGVRSDSDMYTLGYPFRPWIGDLALAPGPAILNYVKETAAAFNITPKIRFNHRLRAAAWSTQTAQWTLDIETAEGPTQLTTNLLQMCGGYYNYESPHAPHFPGQSEFQGALIHPQFWPENLDYKNKKIIVIGSGATAVTLVPAMAPTAAHVTMLQRSPTYIVPRPSRDRLAASLVRILPKPLAARVTRAKNILESRFLYTFARAKPAQTTAKILTLAKKFLGPDYDIATHLTPRYNPWDQRVCLIPDADLFKSIRAGQAAIATGEIQTLTPTGIRLKSGEEIPADIIISATGLQLQLNGGATLTVDGKPVEPAKTLCYKGMMLAGVPNFIFTIGYTNASWTLKSDLVARFTCRLLNHMRRKNFSIATPIRGAGIQETPLLDFTSGYVQRALAHLPKQGTTHPWLLRQDYLKDMPMLRFGKLADGALQFTNP